ncbi:hypothetical protein C8R47DRAFT_1071372 [Mycena vitilis]|nr:hypothetical protein C8R47DRAFT_1071372 [Mycena vitilis]
MSVEFTVFKGSANDDIVESKTRHDGPTGNQDIVYLSSLRVVSGIGGSDEHARHADMVLGREGVGIVQQIGPGEDVFQFKQCETGKDQYCPDQESPQFQLCHRKFPPGLIWFERHPGCLILVQAFKVPEGIAPEHAGPLMCGGATVYNVIEVYNIHLTDRVGVVGVGDLGHLAIQFLAKMGASVVVFSGTDSKREEAIDLGATEFHATKGVEKLGAAKLDHLIVTTSFLLDWNLCGGSVRHFVDYNKSFRLASSHQVYGHYEAHCHDISLDGADRRRYAPLRADILPGPYHSGFTRRRAVRPRVHRNMLDFAACRAQQDHTHYIERFPMTKAGVETGMQKLRSWLQK